MSIPSPYPPVCLWTSIGCGFASGVLASVEELSTNPIELVHCHDLVTTLAGLALQGPGVRRGGDRWFADLPSFHTDYRLPKGFAITRPVFGTTVPHRTGAPRHWTRTSSRPYAATVASQSCSMGSSGTSELLLEAIRALVPPPRTSPVVTSLPTIGTWWPWPHPRCVRFRRPRPSRGSPAFW
jgi:hypothetical protein